MAPVTAVDDHRDGIGQQFAAVEVDLPIAQRFAAAQHLRQMQLRRPMLAGGFQQQVFHRAALAQQALGLVVDDGDAGFIIDRDHAFFNRLQHGVALFEQVGDFVRLETQHDALECGDGEEGAWAADQRGEGDGPIDDPAAFRHHPLHGIQRDAERHHADLLFLRVIHRHEHPQRRGQRAAVDGAVDVALQRGRQIVADKMLADQPGFGVRIADALHIHHHHEQQLVLMAHLLGEALNGAALVAPLQTVNHRAGERQRIGDGDGFLLQLILPLAAHLHEKQREHHQQHRSDDGGHHQRDGGAQRAAPVVLAWRFSEWRYHGVF